MHPFPELYERDSHDDGCRIRFRKKSTRLRKGHNPFGTCLYLDECIVIDCMIDMEKRTSDNNFRQQLRKFIDIAETDGMYELYDVECIHYEIMDNIEDRKDTFITYFNEHPEEHFDEWWKTVDKAKIVMAGIYRGVEFWNNVYESDDE